jgi:hypothetical protein
MSTQQHANAYDAQDRAAHGAAANAKKGGV